MNTNRNIVLQRNDGYGLGSPVLRSVSDSAEKNGCCQAKPHRDGIRAVERLQSVVGVLMCIESLDVLVQVLCDVDVTKYVTALVLEKSIILNY